MDDQRTDRTGGGSVRHRWSWRQFLIAVGLIALSLWWMKFWFDLAFRTGDSLAVMIGDASLFFGPCVIVMCVLWLIWLALVGPVRVKPRFGLRAMLIAITLVALWLGIYVAGK